jgi:hypothetical protein
LRRVNLITEKIFEGYKVINITPDMNEDDRKRAEKDTVKNILSEYNRLENQKSKAVTQK